MPTKMYGRSALLTLYSLTMNLHKTTVEIDLDELARAQAVLHTNGITETVNAALREVNRKAALAAAAELVRAGDFHVPDERTWAAWRAPRS